MSENNERTIAALGPGVTVMWGKYMADTLKVESPTESFSPIHMVMDFHGHKLFFYSSAALDILIQAATEAKKSAFGVMSVTLSLPEKEEEAKP